MPPNLIHTAFKIGVLAEALFQEVNFGGPQAANALKALEGLKGAVLVALADNPFSHFGADAPHLGKVCGAEAVGGGGKSEKAGCGERKRPKGVLRRRRGLKWDDARHPAGSANGLKAARKQKGIRVGSLSGRRTRRRQAAEAKERGEEELENQKFPRTAARKFAAKSVCMWRGIVHGVHLRAKGMPGGRETAHVSRVYLGGLIGCHTR